MRGDDGYVVAPPSRHVSGAAYTWADDRVGVAPAPAWLRPPGRGRVPHRHLGTPPPPLRRRPLRTGRPPPGDRRRAAGGRRRPEQPAEPGRVLPSGCSSPGGEPRRRPGRSRAPGRRPRRRACPRPRPEPAWLVACVPEPGNRGAGQLAHESAKAPSAVRKQREDGLPSHRGKVSGSGISSSKELKWACEERGLGSVLSL